jgi:hypothetical protein
MVQQSIVNSVKQFLETSPNTSSSSTHTLINRTKEPSSDTQLSIAHCQDTKPTLIVQEHPILFNGKDSQIQNAQGSMKMHHIF